MPVKTNWATREIPPVKIFLLHVKKTGKTRKSGREKNGKNGQKWLSRALLIFTGKKKNTAQHKDRGTETQDTETQDTETQDTETQDTETQDTDTKT